MSVKLF